MHPHATQVFSLESIVSKPTWKEILLELIDTKRLEPWKIDIVQIADNYMKKIREMEKISLVIPANIILAASILLRYKSEYLRFEEPVQVIVPLEEGAEFEEMPQLELSARIPPKRQITLDELIQEMEKIIKYETTERVIKHRGGIEEFVNLPLRDVDIEKKMNEILGKIKNSVDDQGWTLFSRVIDKNDKIEIIYTLVSILHLTQKQTIDIKQDEIFGDIFIYLLNEKN
ncbi:segregation/condensation protein A [Candidatus Micrarchaeota archaeon]|nr:segregation/condensation protein A [Candidatus Micrarchaeota archaeon]